MEKILGKEGEIQKDEETMRILTIRKKSWFVRFFLWVWGSDPEKLNLCKLFWGTLFFPLAFFQFKRAYRFIPRITFVYIVWATILVALGDWVNAVMWSILGLLIATGGYIYTRRKQSTTERREEKEKILSKITERGSRFAERMAESRVVEWLGERVDWILENTLGRLFDFIDDMTDSKVGQRIRRFFAIIGEYFHAVKKRYCPIVRVV